MSWKEDYIAEFGEDAYAKRDQDLREANRREWRRKSGLLIQKYSKEWDSKGGKYYAKRRVYNTTGLRGERNIIRKRDGSKWHFYKKIIAPDSQLHHQWQPDSAEYDGVALVEADAHMHGFIDVIQILDGEITLFTEKEIRE
jgi:hypothetical protein